jgi:hypothetical protein
VDTLDHLAIPGALHLFHCTLPLNLHLWQVLKQLASVVAIISNPPMPGPANHFTLHMVSDHGDHHLATRAAMAYPQLQQTTVPLVWYIRILPAPVNMVLPAVPLPNQRAAAINGGRDMTRIMSGHNLRDALINGPVNRMGLALQAFNSLATRSMQGVLAAYPCRFAMPSLVHLSDNGLVFVLQDLLCGKGPWVLAPVAMPIQQIRNSLNNDIAVAGGNPLAFALGRAVLPGPIAVRQTGLTVDIFANGRSSHSFRYRVQQADQRARRHRRVTQPTPILPYAGPPFVPLAVPTLPLYNGQVPNIRRHYILARTVVGDRRKITESIARQVISIVLNPPPVIGAQHVNVSEIVILAERTSSWDIPLLDRRMFTESIRAASANLMHPNDVISVVNMDRVTRNYLELPVVYGAWPNLWSQGLKTAVAEGTYMVVDEDDEGETEDMEDDDEMVGDETTWFQPANEPRTSRHVQIRATLAREHAFYRQCHEMMDVWNAPGATFRAMLQNYAQVNQLPRCYTYRRVSEGPVGGQSHLNLSLRRQQRFLDQIAPPNTGHLELAFVSIVRDGTGVVELLDTLSDALVLITSVDRLARNSTAMQQIWEIAERRNLHIIATLWLSTDMPALANIPYPFPLQQGSATELAHTSLLGVHGKTRLSFYPMLIAGPNLSNLAVPIVLNRISASQDFISGFQASAYRGDPKLAIPANQRSGNGVNGLTPAMRQNIMQTIQPLAPNCNISLVAYQGQNAISCGCVVGGCRRECQCRCQQTCLPNYNAIDGGIANCPLYCACTRSNRAHP